MAFIEPMHRNKPNITYLLTEKKRQWNLNKIQSHSFSEMLLKMIL